MTIETANRLVEYRKKNNLSQEDVAEKEMRILQLLQDKLQDLQEMVKRE